MKLFRRFFMVFTILFIVLPLFAQVDETVVKLKIRPPRYDGGAIVTHYIIEWRLESSPIWTRETKLPAISEYTIRGLAPGTYSFRVLAVNSNGTGEPGEVKDVILVKGKTVTCRLRCGDGLVGLPAKSALLCVEESDFMRFLQVSSSPVPYRLKE